jgi:peptidoglycan/LPS O-acetylase OafA/YrhL
VTTQGHLTTALAKHARNWPGTSAARAAVLLFEGTVQEMGMIGELKAVSGARQVGFRGHIAELDTLRALGLCLVLTDHFWPRALSEAVFRLGELGWIAMDSFFVMSGFLITGILLDTRDKPGYYRNYYARRSLRIFPLYYVVLVAWYCIARYTNSGVAYHQLVSEWGSPAWFTFYLGNIREAVVGAWPLVPGYGSLWSLQIEEQYYLLFPLAVALMKREHLRKLLIAAVILSPVCRVLTYLWQPDNVLMQFVLLPCHCEGLALGGLIAIRFRQGEWNIPTRKLALGTGLLLSFTAITSFLTTWHAPHPWSSSPWDRLVGYSISSAGCAGLVLLLICLRDSKYTRWMRIAPLQYLGKISYGVYLLHPLAWWILSELIRKGFLHFRVNDPLWFVDAVGTSLILAALSWHLFEAPILKLKDRFRYRARAAA